jgi:hypothetical protein
LAFSSFWLADAISLEVLSLGRKVDEDLNFHRKLVTADLLDSSFASLWQQSLSDSEASSTLKKISSIQS